MKKLSKAQQARNVVKAIVAVAQHLLEQAPTEKPTMSQTLRKYRVGYEKAVSYSKGATLDNGDALATAMRGLTPAQACELADLATGSEVGTHLARYASLNVGQQRMNSGNRVRSLIKKGELAVEAALALVAQVRTVAVEVA